MNYLAPKSGQANNGALDESAPKKVSLFPNLGSQKAGKNRAKTGRLSSFYKANDDMITAAQLRAARGLLDWTRADLAKAANISPETVKNIEHGTFRPQENTADAIIKAFGTRDVKFTENEGVQLLHDTVIRYDGIEQFKSFMDSVYEAACDSEAAVNGSKPIYVSNVNDRLFVKYLGDYLQVHLQRMNALKNVKVRVLIGEKDLYMVQEGSYLEYRWNPKQDAGNVPFYVYGDRLAVIIFDETKPPSVVVISSSLVSKAYREQFEVLWKNSKLPDDREQ